MNDFMYIAVKLRSSDETDMEGNSLKRNLQMITGDDTDKTMISFVKYVILYGLLMYLDGTMKRDPSTNIIIFKINMNSDLLDDEYTPDDIKWIFKNIAIPLKEEDIISTFNKDSLLEFNFGPKHIQEVVNSIGTFNIFDTNVKFTQNYIINEGESNFRKWYKDVDHSDISEDLVRHIMETGLAFIVDLKRYNANDNYTYPIEYTDTGLPEKTYLPCFTAYCATMILSHISDEGSTAFGMSVSVLNGYRDLFKEKFSDPRAITWCRLMDYSIATNPWSIRYLINTYMSSTVNSDINYMIDGGKSKDHIHSIICDNIIIIINYIIAFHDELGIMSITILKNIMVEAFDRIDLRIDKLLNDSHQ